ncbi:MAG: single-stranded DNA-binding protein [Hyphomonadaceae bacterium]|nr:single-stranded DNA-binding protein [Clostridia bacterium]
MIENTLENNVAHITGIVESELSFHHEVYGEAFYQFYLKVPRLSESFDSLPVTISERLILEEGITVGQRLSVLGQFRSYNNYITEGNRLLLTIFAREYTVLDPDSFVKNPNNLFVNGFLCKKPVYRTTPFGREICDLLVAVNRAYNKSDYLPCIAWGRNARYCENLAIGENIKIWGRIQSREYQKKTDEGTLTKIAFEVSVCKLEI